MAWPPSTTAEQSVAGNWASEAVAQTRSVVWWDADGDEDPAGPIALIQAFRRHSPVATRQYTLRGLLPADRYSVVAWDDKGEVLVGQIAKRQAVSNPENTIFSFNYYSQML